MRIAANAVMFLIVLAVMLVPVATAVAATDPGTTTDPNTASYRRPVDVVGHAATRRDVRADRDHHDRRPRPTTTAPAARDDHAAPAARTDDSAARARRDDYSARDDRAARTTRRTDDSSARAHHDRSATGRRS